MQTNKPQTNVTKHLLIMLTLAIINRGRQVFVSDIQVFISDIQVHMSDHQVSMSGYNCTGIDN